LAFDVKRAASAAADYQYALRPLTKRWYWNPQWGVRFCRQISGLARPRHPVSNRFLRFKNRKRLNFNRKYEPGEACEDFSKPSAQNLLYPGSSSNKPTYNLNGG
jgi:hypothetical protein